LSTLRRLLPRFRLRTILIAVAVMSLALGGWISPRRAVCLARAMECERMMDRLSTVIPSRRPGEPPRRLVLDYLVGSFGRYYRLAEYDRYLADRPWLPLPDEPGPSRPE
jgi:hypothetical protein